MENQNYTPGPWGFGQDTIFTTGENSGKKVICHTGIQLEHPPKRYFSIEEDKANARLIAAAPDLLEALQGLCGHVPSVRNWQNAHDAIKKAGGQIR